MLRPRPTRLPLALPALCAAALAAFAPSARAEAGESALTLGPLFRGLSEATPDTDAVFRPAFGLEARYRYGLDDFFQLGLALDLGLATDSATGPAFVGALTAEVHYVIDIVTWVPYVTLGLGTLVRDAVPGASALRPDLIATFGGGLEYRPARDHAFDLHGRYELALTDLDRTSSFSVVLGYTLFFE